MTDRDQERKVEDILRTAAQLLSLTGGLLLLLGQLDLHLTKSARRDGILRRSGSGDLLSNGTSLRGQRDQQSPELFGYQAVL